MALYTTPADILACYGDYNVRMAFASKGEGNPSYPLDATVNAKIQKAMDVMHRKLGKAFTVPFPSPFPNQIVTLCQRLTLLVARKDSNGDVLPDGYQASWDEAMKEMDDYSTSAQQIDGVSINAKKFIASPALDGRGRKFTNYVYDELGNIVGPNPDIVPSTEKIL